MNAAVGLLTQHSAKDVLIKEVVVGELIYQEILNRAPVFGSSVDNSIIDFEIKVSSASNAQVNGNYLGLFELENVSLSSGLGPEDYDEGEGHRLTIID